MVSVIPGIYLLIALLCTEFSIKASVVARHPLQDDSHVFPFGGAELASYTAITADVLKSHSCPKL